MHDFINVVFPVPGGPKKSKFGKFDYFINFFIIYFMLA